MIVLCGGVTFRRSLRFSEDVQYRELLSLLSNVFLCRNSTDFRFWKPSISGEFSVKAFHRAPSLVWTGLVPPRVEAFCWLAVAAKISSVDNLKIRGLTASTITDTCVMCHKELKLVNHLLLHCEFTSSVWGHVIGRCGVDWCYLEKIADAAESWLGDCCWMQSYSFDDNSICYFVVHLEGKK